MTCSCKTTAPVPNEYRTVPFWSWNDELEPDELVRQIRAMKQAGLGGFFMHARSGLKTPYMGERWFECVKACILEAERLGLDAWLYDEIGWPSGFGGGEVNASGDEFRQKFLRFRTVRREECAVEQVAGLYSPDGSRYLGSDPSELPAGEILEITYEVNPFYVDVLNPAVTEKFLAVTHQRYFDTLGAGLCRRIKGIFTDEPQVVIGRPVWAPTLNAAYAFTAWSRSCSPGTTPGASARGAERTAGSSPAIRCRRSIMPKQSAATGRSCPITGITPFPARTGSASPNPPSMSSRSRRARRRSPAESA